MTTRKRRRAPGAGRPTMFEGKRVKVHITLTAQAFDIVEAERRDLEPEYGNAATVASAVESLVWKGAGKKPPNQKTPPET